MKNIIVAFSDHQAGQRIRTMLVGTGINVVAVCTSVAQIIMTARRYGGSGVVISGVVFSDNSVFYAAEQLLPDYEFLIISHDIPDAIYDKRGMYGLQLPLNKNDLVDTVKMLMFTGSDKIKSLSFAPNRENDYLEITKSKDVTKVRSDKKERSPEEQKIIDDAKQLLMNRNNLTEEQAHRFLQKKSMDMGCRLIDTAKNIIDNW